MSETKITAYKGFKQNMTCRDFQYEVGKEYEHNGKASACNSGFHACEYPLDVFNYYAPSASVFAVVEQSGDLSTEANGDSKIASSKISIKARVELPELIKAAIEYTFSRSKPEGLSATGYEGKAMGKNGNALFLVERNNDYEIIAVWAGIVGKKKIKEGVWYMLKGGKPVEVTK